MKINHAMLMANSVIWLLRFRIEKYDGKDYGPGWPGTQGMLAASLVLFWVYFSPWSGGPEKNAKLLAQIDNSEKSDTGTEWDVRLYHYLAG